MLLTRNFVNAYSSNRLRRPLANRSTPDMESIASTRADFRPAVIKGLRVEETAEKEVSYEDGVSAFLAGTLVRLIYSTIFLAHKFCHVFHSF